LKISEKAALAMAGYTKAEIEAMEKPVPQPVPQPAPQPAQQPAPQPAQQPVPQPAPQPAPQYDGLETLLQQILQGQQTSAQAMQTMTQTLQANALGLGIQQQPAADAATVTARIIDPTYGKEVK
jgi:outer membrane biosynthesis protein TonB